MNVLRYVATVTLKNIDSYWQTTPEEDGIIHRVNSAESPGNRYVPSFRNRSWDGFVRMYNVTKKTLPAGLAADTITALREGGYPVKILDPGDLSPAPRPGASVNFELSDHQLRAVVAMSESSRGIVHAATNSGKTKIAEAWCALNDCNVLYLVPTKELLHQTVASFKADTNLEVGWISATEGWNPTQNGVTVCLVSSVIKRKSRGSGKVKNEATAKRFQELAKSFQAVLVDECHHSSADGWRWVLRSMVNARFRFGLSGTPWAQRDEAAALKVKAYLGPVIARVTNDELIQKSWSALPVIHMVPVNGVSAPIGIQLEFVEMYENGIVYNDLRNSMIIKLCEQFAASGKLCLVIIHRVAHGEILGELLDLKGIDHRVITGQTDSEERQQNFQDFKVGRFPVLVSNVLSEGVDVPALNGLIFASGGKGSKQTLQRVGRGLRKKLTGENTVEIYDFIDSGFSYLKTHSRRRMQIYRQENFEIRETKITF